jgi:RHS repeat-associated protein
MFADLTQDVVAGGLYDTLNRKYHTAQGRWTSPDPEGIAAVNPEDPQTWNQYAYVMNDPLTLTDPSGLCGKGGDDGNPASCWFQDHRSDFESSTDSMDRAAGKFDVDVPIVIGSERPSTFLGYDCSFPCLSPRPPSQVTSAAVQVVKDALVGSAKEAVNTIIDLANRVNKPVDALLSTFTDFRFGQMSEFKASTPGEKSAMAGVFVVSFFTGAGEEKAAAKGGRRRKHLQ